MPVTRTRRVARGWSAGMASTSRTTRLGSKAASTERCGISKRCSALIPRTVLLERVLAGGELAVAYLGGEPLHRVGQYPGQVRVPLDESRRLSGTQAGHVLPDEYLGVAVRPGA